MTKAHALADPCIRSMRFRSLHEKYEGFETVRRTFDRTASRPPAGINVRQRHLRLDVTEGSPDDEAKVPGAGPPSQVRRRLPREPYATTFLSLAPEVATSGGPGHLVADSDDQTDHRHGRVFGIASSPAENILRSLLVLATTARCFKLPLSANYGADRVAEPNAKTRMVSLDK